MAASASAASVRAFEQKVERWMKKVERSLDELRAKESTSKEECTEPVEMMEGWMKKVDRALDELNLKTNEFGSNSLAKTKLIENDTVHSFSSSNQPNTIIYTEKIPTQPFEIEMGDFDLDGRCYLFEAEVTFINTDITESASVIVGLFLQEECIGQTAASWSGRWDGSGSGRGMQTVSIRGRWTISESTTIQVSLRTTARHASSVIMTHQPSFPVKLWVTPIER